MNSTPSSTVKRYYAGIGSRKAPPKVKDQMTILAAMLEARGFRLRSGNADGSDQAFALGVEREADIWLPDANFNKEFRKVKPLHNYIIGGGSDIEALKSVIKFHPAPNRLTPKGCLFMARNYRQVIGLNEPNSEFVVAWTEGGEMKGGTAQAMRIAKYHGITVVNMFGDVSAQQVIDYLSIWHEL
jgi:hypothetical protein